MIEPQPTFSACFGGPFMAQKPNVYAKLLSKEMKKHKARIKKAGYMPAFFVGARRNPDEELVKK